MANQFDYYQRAKQRIFREQDLYSFVIVKDFSKLDIEKGASYQDQIFTVYFNPQNPTILSYKYIHYIDNSKNDKYFVFKSWEKLLEENGLFVNLRNNENNQQSERRFKIFVFSDGARKHYKQRFSVAWLAFLQHKYTKVDFEWNFFISNHGFNSCDSAASHAKRRLTWFVQSFESENLATCERVAQCITHHVSEQFGEDYMWKGVKNHEAYSIHGLIFRTVNNPENITIINEIATLHQFVFSRFTNGDVSLLTYKLSKEVNTNDDVTQTIFYASNCDEFDELTIFWEGIKELGAQPQEERQPTRDS